MSITEYISNKEIKNFSWNGIEIYIKDPIRAKNFSIKSVFDRISNLVPSHLMKNLNSIYVGEFEHLLNRDLRAMYNKSSIYVTNNQENEEDMIDDIIHELAHSVEESLQGELYADGLLEKEFLLKRKQLWRILKNQSPHANLEKRNFMGVQYNRMFDEFLYKKIGYDALRSLTSEIFFSPYGATSLREYFANGFEAFFYHRDITKLENISPILYKKCVMIMDLEERESKWT